MNNILLVTRPKFDDGTEYLAYYAGLVLKNAKDKGVKTKDFEGKEANFLNVSKFILKQDPKLIFLNGHGDIESIDGHEGILFSMKNVNLLKNRIIYARACHAANVLGKKAVENNDGCFIGYKAPFSFILDERWSTKPSNDKTAALFLEPSNEIMYSLISGKFTSNADKKSKKMMIENMNVILKMEEKKEPGASVLLQVLWTNFDNQVLLGNKEAKF